MIEKPKKERKFLKLLGKVGEILVQELLLKVGKSLVQKIGGKKTLPSIIFLSLFYNIAFASIDSIPYPITGNKQRLGWQTSGNGLVWRGRSNDTITKPTNYVDKNVKAYLILDSVRGTIFVWRQTYWDSLLVDGAGKGLTMPFDSITFNTAKDATVGVGEVEYNDTQGSLIQGLKGGNVTNVIGQQLHQRVNNRTGATLNKGDVVYLSGSQGNRITVAKAIATSDPTSANTFGIVAESIADNASGYVITEGLITGLNTSALIQDSAVYLSGTTAGVLTSTKPQAPIHGVYIGVCVKSNAGSGEVFVKIRNGQELDELHDVAISSPVDKASLYYKSSEGLWRDTTAALLVSDTAAMLTPYFRDADTTSLNLTSRFAAKLNISDTASMLTNYLRTGVSASTYLPLAGGTVIGNTNFVPTSGRVIFGETSPVWDEVLGVRPRTTTSLGLGIYSSSSSYSGSLFRAQSENATGSAYMLYEGRGNGGIAKFWVKGDGSSFFAKNMTIGSQTNYDALNVHHSGDEGFRMSYLTEPTSYFFQIRPYQSANNVRYVFSQTNNNIFYDSVFVLNQGNIAINKLNPSYKLDINGTFGVTGATTLSAPLTVNSSAVFNEGSADADFRVESDGNANMLFVDASTDRVGIGTNSPTKTLDVNGEVKISTTTATPTSLLGKDGSNVVGEVTTVAQTGLMKAGGTTANTSSVGIITVAHGLSYTPSQVIATVAQQNSYVIVCHSKDGTNMSFTVYDSVTGNALNNVSVGFFWLAIK